MDKFSKCRRIVGCQMCAHLNSPPHAILAVRKLHYDGRHDPGLVPLVEPGCHTGTDLELYQHWWSRKRYVMPRQQHLF